MDRQAERCPSCDHLLGVGRYCVSCGRPSTEPTADLTEPRSEAPPHRAPVSPPPVYEAPPPARYPLFADEAAPAPTETPHAAYEPSPGLAETAVGLPVLLPVPAPARLPPTAHRRRPGGPWRIAAAASVVALVLLGAGGMALLGDSDPDPSATDGTGSGSASPTSAPSETGEGGEDGPLDLTRFAEASPPGTASPSRDVRGNAVRYEAFNMLDGQPDTAWRIAGDASGQEVVFRLDGPTRITEVGLINGYAKVEPGYDGYSANRRIASVEWMFADGTVVPQTLVDGLSVQSVPVSDVVSDTVTLRILTVTEPASGPSGRDYTAISDVSLVGSPA